MKAGFCASIVPEISLVKKRFIPFFLIPVTLLSVTNSAKSQDREAKTIFQIADPWNADYDVRSDAALVYGINDAGGNFKERVKGYLEKGYQAEFMTGIAWGQYQDYFTGKFDGKTHWDEGQVTRNGDTIWHGHLVPYIVPTKNYLKYIESHIKTAIDAGVTSIYMEEPEFWARAGHSDAFKNEWQKYYGSAWRPQDESAEATYLSSKLKYHLYYEALKAVFDYSKTYGKTIGKDIKCYVPTHSLINYSLWQIVSPEASLASLKNMDGYIAQVWTGTAREPIFFNGIQKERVFENAFLEYGSMVSMTAPTNRKIYFLTDPIEDRSHSWEDYKVNYEATFTAQLLFPTVNNYEVMPWPKRIYKGKFKVQGTEEKQPIPQDYATQMQVMVNSLNSMPLSSNKLNGSRGIGVLLANSMMFQRFPTHQGYDDPALSNFYGMALPLLKRGIPLETVHIENLQHPTTLKDVKVLVMSYANMKPPSVENHIELSKWVKNGGVLVYCGRDDDPFQNVKEWWNSNGNNFKTPAQHLFKQMSIFKKPSQKRYSYGQGFVYIIRKDPKEFVLAAKGDIDFIKDIENAYQKDAKAGDFLIKNNFILNRGPYVIAAVVDENEKSSPLKIQGSLIDLFDPKLPVVKQKNVEPGEQAYLYDINQLKDKSKPAVLAAAARVYEEKADKNHYHFVVKSPSNTVNIMRILLPAKPKEISLKQENIGEIPLKQHEWDNDSHTLLLGFENYSDGVKVDLSW